MPGPEDVVREYYGALRRGEPLSPYFLEDGTTVKFGVSEASFGYEAVAEALGEQQRTTADWTVESDGPVVDERDGYATVADEVRLAWTDSTTGQRWTFETRWSGTLADTEDGWLFVSMHVSAPREL